MFALITFVLVSGYHFGQQQFETFKNLENESVIKFFYLMYGLFILFLLFMFNKVEVIQVVFEITNFHFSIIQIETSFWIIVILLILSAITLAMKSDRFRNDLILELFLLGFFSVIFLL